MLKIWWCLIDLYAIGKVIVMRVSLAVDKMFLDNDLGLQYQAHEQMAVHMFMSEPGKFVGQGWITADKPYGWREMNIPQPYNALSAKGSENIQLGAEVVTDNTVSLHASPMAFMDPSARARHLVEGGLGEGLAKAMADAGEGSEIVLHLGSHASLVFKDKAELLSFLGQCVEIHQRLQEP